MRSFGRIGLYVAAAALAYAVIWLVRLGAGEATGTQAGIRVLIAMAVALLVGMPGGFALAMAKE